MGGVHFSQLPKFLKLWAGDVKTDSPGKRASMSPSQSLKLPPFCSTHQGTAKDTNKSTEKAEKMAAHKTARPGQKVLDLMGNDEDRDKTKLQALVARLAPGWEGG